MCKPVCKLNKIPRDLFTLPQSLFVVSHLNSGYNHMLAYYNEDIDMLPIQKHFLTHHPFLLP